MERLAGAERVGRRGVTVDVDRCIGCYNCFLACRDEHVGNDRPGVAAAQPPAGQSWIRIRELEQGSFPHVKMSYVPVMCMHCDDAPCMEVDTDGAVYRRADGVVIIDPEKAVGRRELVEACPFGVIFWNEEASLAQKCTLCAHLLDDGWARPRCVEACPTDALVFGDLDDPASEIATLRRARVAEELRPELGVRPAVAYLGLPKRFVAGDVAFADRPEEPATGVVVRLEGGEGELEVTTDAFGDFELAGLADEAAYRLVVEHPGYVPVELPVGASAESQVVSLVLDIGDEE